MLPGVAADAVERPATVGDADSLANKCVPNFLQGSMMTTGGIDGKEISPLIETGSSHSIETGQPGRSDSRIPPAELKAKRKKVNAKH